MSVLRSDKLKQELKISLIESEKKTVSEKLALLQVDTHKKASLALLFFSLTVDLWLAEHIHSAVS